MTMKSSLSLASLLLCVPFALGAVELRDRACDSVGRVFTAELVDKLPNTLQPTDLFDGVFEIRNGGSFPVTFAGFRSERGFRIDRPAYGLEVQDTAGLWHVGATYLAGSFEGAPDRLHLWPGQRARVIVRVGTNREMLPTEVPLATPLRFRMMIISRVPHACIFSAPFPLSL